MSKIKEQQLIKDIDMLALRLWATMVTWLYNTDDRIDKLEERIRKLENKEVRK